MPVRSATAMVTVDGGGAGGDNWVNVRDFGAVGDDVNDDGPAIAAALSSLPASGGTIFFPPGTYAITTPIAVAMSNVWLIGSSATIDNKDQTGQPALIIGAQVGFILNCAVQRLNFTGDPMSGSGIVLDLVSGILIQDVSITGGGGHGIEMPGEVLATTFERVTITGRTFLKDAWHISTQVQSNVLRWISCVAGGNSVTSQGLYVVPVVGGNHVDWVFENCAFQACQHGMWLNSVVGVVIIGQYFEANSAGDIRIGTLGDVNSGCRVITVLTAVANGSLFGGYFLRLEEGARLTVIGLSSTLHARTFSIVSAAEGGETVQIMNFQISGDTVMYEAGTTEATAFPGPIKGVQGLSGEVAGTVVTPRNLRGTAIIAAAAVNASVVFTTPEDDAVYYITAIVSATTGAPAAGSTRVFITGKIAAGFTINLEAAPGLGNSVTVDWIMTR